LIYNSAPPPPPQYCQTYTGLEKKRKNYPLYIVRNIYGGSQTIPFTLNL
jgi:hypothetical protein